MASRSVFILRIDFERFLLVFDGVRKRLPVLGFKIRFQGLTFGIRLQRVLLIELHSVLIARFAAQTRTRRAGLHKPVTTPARKALN